MARQVVVIMGSPRKGRTLKVVKQFEKELQRMGEADFQYIFLRDMQLEPCRGCELCLAKGEQFCPFKDDRDNIYDRLMAADGTIFATPVYSLQVTALLKNLLDRFAYVFHRPCFFHKTSMAIVTQGVIGGDKVVEYLNELAAYWGYKVCPGLFLTVPWEKPLPGEEEKMNTAIKAAAARFHKLLTDPAPYIPTLKQVIIFRAVQSVHAVEAGLASDRQYYQARGWLTADYYYPTRINWAKKLIGKFIGHQVRRQSLQAKAARGSAPQ